MVQVKFKPGTSWLIVSSLLALSSFVGLGYLLTASRSPAPVSVRLLKAERGTVETVITESGEVKLGNQQTLVSPVEGAVEQVLVDLGDRIQLGQVLLTLRNPERQTALVQQELKITQQEITLERSWQKGREAESKLAIAQERLQRLEIGAAEGAIPQAQVYQQQVEVQAIESELRDAATAANTANLELESLKLERQRTERELQDTVVVAPLHGVVLGVNVKDGDGVELRTELITVGDPSRELVQLELSTLNAMQVKLKQPARVSMIGPNPQIFSGSVAQIYPLAIASTESNQPGGNRSAQPGGLAKVPTTIQLDQPTRSLIPGSQVSVEIVLEQRQDVVTLGVEAIQQAESGPFVWKVDDRQTVQPQPVTLGLEGLITVEIQEGLQVGDTIALPPPDSPLTPNTPITPAAL